MSTSQRCHLRVEALEERTVPSITPLVTVSAGGQVTLHGDIRGTWAANLSTPETGVHETVNGWGTVQPLGRVQASGDLQIPGFLRMGQWRGKLTLTDARGSLTLSLLGPLAGDFSKTPGTLSYTITGGTGQYAGTSGHGTAGLQQMLPRMPRDQFGPVRPDYLIAAAFVLHF
jgi:hypothetical protein